MFSAVIFMFSALTFMFSALTFGDVKCYMLMTIPIYKLTLCKVPNTQPLTAFVLKALKALATILQRINNSHVMFRHTTVTGCGVIVLSECTGAGLYPDPDVLLSSYDQVLSIIVLLFLFWTTLCICDILYSLLCKYSLL